MTICLFFCSLITLFLLKNLKVADCDLQIFSSNDVIYGQDYIFIQLRYVQHTTNVNADRITVYKNATSGYVKILESDFNTVTWFNTTIGDRTHTEAMKGSRTRLLDVQIPREQVDCSDSGRYKGSVELSDGTYKEKETNIEVKVIPDKMEDIKLLSGHNETLPFPLNSRLMLRCTGAVGDPPKDMNWCIQYAHELQSGIYEDQSQIDLGTPLLSGCQYTQSSNLTYVVTDKDILTTLRCYSGDSNQCNDNIIPHKEYVIRKATTSSSQRLSWNLLILFIGTLFVLVQSNRLCYGIHV